MRLKVWFRVIFAPVLGLHHANRTMKKSIRFFRDSTHKCLTGIDPVPVAPDAVLLKEPFFD